MGRALAKHRLPAQASARALLGPVPMGLSSEGELVIAGDGWQRTIQLLVAPSRRIFFHLDGTYEIPDLGWSRAQQISVELREAAEAVDPMLAREHARDLHMPADDPERSPLYAVNCHGTAPGPIYQAVALRTMATHTHVALWTRGRAAEPMPLATVTRDGCSICGTIPCLHGELAGMTGDRPRLAAYLKEQIARSAGARRQFWADTHQVDIARATTPLTIVLEHGDRDASAQGGAPDVRRFHLYAQFPGNGTIMPLPAPWRMGSGPWKVPGGLGPLVKLIEKIAPTA